ncbi:MAG: hypothetical protein ACPGEC_06045, partial [Flavobacteriales bacterium]
MFLMFFCTQYTWAQEGVLQNKSTSDGVYNDLLKTVQLHADYPKITGNNPNFNLMPIIKLGSQ